MFFDFVHAEVEGLDRAFRIACFDENIGECGVDIKPFGGDLHGVVKGHHRIAVLSEVGLGHAKGVMCVVAFGVDLDGLL